MWRDHANDPKSPSDSLEGKGSGEKYSSTAGPGALQQKTLSTGLGLDPLSLLTESARGEALLANSAKASLQIQWSLQLIFSQPLERCSPSSLQDTTRSLCHASQHQDLAALGQETFVTQKRTESK